MIPFELRQLQQAVALAEHRSFSRAAAALNQAQPTLSRAIQELERRVGGQLFHRNRHAVEPTEFGWLFLQHARDIVAQAQDLERETRLAKGLQSGSVSVGLGPYAAEALLPVAAPRFVAAHPDIRVSIEVDAPEALLRDLRARRVSFTLAEVSVLGKEHDLEVAGAFAPLQGYVVGRAGHPLALQTRSSVEDAFAYPFAIVAWLPPRLLRPILRAQEARRLAGGQTVAAFPAVNCPSVGIAKRIVEQSDVLMFAPLALVQDELKSGRIVPLATAPWLKTGFGIVRLRNRTLSPAAAAFIEQLRQRYEEILQIEASLTDRWGLDGAGRGVSHRPRTRRRAPADSATVEGRSRR